MRLAPILLAAGVLVAGVLAGCAADEDTSGATAAPGAVPAAGAVPVPAASAITPEPTGPRISEVPPAREVTGEVAAYGSTDDSVLNGYFVLPADVVEPAPGVIMIHDSFGLDDSIQALARRLAGEGYAVLAIDLFDGQTASASGEAEILLAGIAGERAAVLDNICQAHSFLQQSAVAPRVAMVGFGLGGDWSLESGIALGDDIDAVVTFYGQVINDQARLRPLTAPLLGLFAAQDNRIPVREATLFRSTLRDLNKTAIVLIHSNVEHGFANPAGPAYAHEAANESWASTVEFLRGQLLP